jgi:transcriptional regulator with XRE-family HTH domain
MIKAKADLESSRAAVIGWIAHILDRRKWTGTDLARKAGLAPSTVLRLLNDPNHRFIPSLRTLQKISDGSGYPIPRKVTQALGAARIEGSNEDAGGAPTEGANYTPRSRFHTSSPAARPTVQLRHVSSLPSTLRSQAPQDVTVPCAPQVEGDETAFAFYAPDGALDPWVKAGTLIYATKRRDPMGGDLVLVTDSQGRSRVRLLISIDEKGLTTSKAYPPQGEDVVAFADVKDIAIVAVIVKL